MANECTDNVECLFIFNITLLGSWDEKAHPIPVCQRRRFFLRSTYLSLENGHSVPACTSMYDDDELTAEIA